MLDQIKSSLKDCLNSIDPSIFISDDEIDVSLLFDEKGDLLEYKTREKCRKKIVIKTFDKNDNLINKEIQKF